MKDAIYDIVSRLMSVSKDTLTPESSPLNVEGWDSLKHMKLMLELESSFGLEFDADQILHMVTIQRIEDTVSGLLNGKAR
ncbi:MAG: hypothetical protein FD177_1407 [Desulfovibrionaceae bacterium]|nr:MAG: hypothetical protein FD177_1407 [Desulfovibrionaceae bacterium]